MLATATDGRLMTIRAASEPSRGDHRDRGYGSWEEKIQLLERWGRNEWNTNKKGSVGQSVGLEKINICPFESPQIIMIEMMALACLLAYLLASLLASSFVRSKSTRIRRRNTVQWMIGFTTFQFLFLFSFFFFTKTNFCPCHGTRRLPATSISIVSINPRWLTSWLAGWMGGS